MKILMDGTLYNRVSNRFFFLTSVLAAVSRAVFFSVLFAVYHEEVSLKTMLFLLFHTVACYF